MNPKSWYTSKTLWANILVGIIAVIGILGSTAGQDGAPLIPAEWMKYFLAASAVLNVFLRLLTSQPIVPIDPPNGGGKMRTFILIFVLALALVACIPCEAYARPRLASKAANAVATQLKEGAERRQNRREEGRGLGRLAKLLPRNWGC